MNHDRGSGSHIPPSSAAGLPGTPRDQTVDVLSDVLEQVRLRGAVFFAWEPGWPYVTAVPDSSLFSALVMPWAQRIISYHIVLDGPCWAAVPDEPAVRLTSGDVLVLPHGDAYVMSHAPADPCLQDVAAARAFFRAMAEGALPPVVVDGGPGPQRNRLICGFLGCDLKPFNPLLTSLPRLLRVPAANGPDHLQTLVELAAAETRVNQPGGRCALLRLSELLFVEVIRRHLRQSRATEGWLAALADPLVGRALRRLHAAPQRDWSLAILAVELHVARSVLAERFTRLVGRPPMQYLAHWRMQLAANRLVDGESKVYTVAKEVGYSSEAAFSRAFKRLMGVSPVHWRACRKGGAAP